MTTLEKLDRMSDPYEADGSTLKPDRGLVLARLNIGGRTIVGSVSHSRYGASAGPRLVYKRGRRQDYLPISQSNIDNGNLQIKVGARYVAAKDVIA